MPPATPAHLDERPGHGYAVVESLSSLGKGRACTGLFVGDREHGPHFRSVMEERRRIPFRGPVHSRHRSGPADLGVEVTRVEEEEGKLLVEFAVEAVPYDVIG